MGESNLIRMLDGNGHAGDSSVSMSGLCRVCLRDCWVLQMVRRLVGLTWYLGDVDVGSLGELCWKENWSRKRVRLGMGFSGCQIRVGEGCMCFEAVVSRKRCVCRTTLDDCGEVNE